MNFPLDFIFFLLCVFLKTFLLCSLIWPRTWYVDLALNWKIHLLLPPGLGLKELFTSRIAFKGAREMAQ